MGRRVTRRDFLAGLTAPVAAGAIPGITRAQSESDAGGFTPIEHGYGFRNWGVKDQYFDSPPAPTQAKIRERIRTKWVEQARAVLGLDVGALSRAMVSAVATQLRAAVVQRAGTNGHCYGMALTAQRYFERPETIPVNRRRASEIEVPTVPVDEPIAPVYDEIVQRQADQYLRFRAFLARQAILYRDWIDTEAILRDVGNVIERFGTATLILFNNTLLSHQVLAYGFEDRGDSVVVPIYDPNLPASAYRRRSPRLEFERDGESVSMHQYGQYTGMLFSRYDRIEDAADRTAPTPMDHVTVDQRRVRESLFPFTLVVATSEDVDLTVVGPGGSQIGRIRGVYTDRSRGEYGRVRSQHGAEPGTYRISVFGTADTEYELTAMVTDADGASVNAARTETIRTGDEHEYDLEVTQEGAGGLRRVRTDRNLPALVGTGVAGVAAGAVGYRTVKRLRERDRHES
ncbi:hypothetical protein [Halobellus sp. H-GB7]|uniref:hypothetical protein n=1 Tax=Halobellus sp. H-GB7 TaxID=3069756 RepID=UPI0027B0857B|nr:hypothetical protein [Halobellus sp. H-GB7]MDQ2053008.1 hypothetical protein [Halobellus sp. H-GB7]